MEEAPAQPIRTTILCRFSPRIFFCLCFLAYNSEARLFHAIHYRPLVFAFLPPYFNNIVLVRPHFFSFNCPWRSPRLLFFFACTSLSKRIDVEFYYNSPVALAACGTAGRVANCLIFISPSSCRNLTSFFRSKEPASQKGKKKGREM